VRRRAELVAVAVLRAMRLELDESMIDTGTVTASVRGGRMGLPCGGAT
jgi:hypothetical protein